MDDMDSAENTNLTQCQINKKLYYEDFNFKLHLLRVEQSNVIYTSKNSSSFLTIFTLAWSSLGIALSTAALLLLILTAALFAEWRRSYKNQLLIQFMLARFLYTFVRYFGDVQKLFNICPYTGRIVLLDLVFMIYTEMALVAWMFVFSRQIYTSLVKVFTTERWSICKVSICSWLGPTTVAILLHVMFNVGQDATHQYLVAYIVIIKWPILIANAVLLIIALRSVLRNNMKTKKNIRIVLVMIMLIFLFCFQQMVIDMFKIVFLEIIDTQNIMNTTLIITNIFSMYHCAFSICFWVLGNANTRKLWRFHGKDLSTKLRLSMSS